MLYFVLTVSILHLACMNWLVYRKAYISSFLFASIVPFGLMCVAPSPTVFMQAIVLFVLSAICVGLAPNRPVYFQAASVLVVCVIYGLAAGYTLNLERDLLDRYPMESMAARVPAPKLGKPLADVPEAKAWSVMEQSLSEELKTGYSWRAHRLQKLHEETTENFVNSSGFGVTRMPLGVLNSGGYDYGIEPDKKIRQPETTEPPIDSPPDSYKPIASLDTKPLSEMHFSGLADFVNLRGFGYIKDRDHVAGFRPHRFSQAPKSESLRLKRLELVSLLMHETPAVYVSDELPAMKELKKAPTRSLSDFEAMGIAAIQNGEDLFVRETPDGIHMIGAIRSVSVCGKCHGGERGDLLGAFSYSLQRTP
jgi:hypothetical protein